MLERKIADAIIDHPRAVLGIAALITLISLLFAPRVGFNSSIGAWFLDDDPDLVTYWAFIERFEADEITVVGVFPKKGALFTPQGLKDFEGLAKAVEAAPYVHRAYSLFNARIIDTSQGMMETSTLMESGLPDTPEAAAALKEQALANDLIRGRLLSEDGEAAALIVELSPDNNTFDAKMAQTVALRKIAEGYSDTYDLRLAGSPPVNEAFIRYSSQDYLLFVPLMSLLIFVATYFLFGSLSATLITLVSVSVATLWLFGVMGILGVDLTIVSSGLLAMILAVGVADSVHVLSAYYQRVSRGMTPDEATRDGLAHLLLPCLFTSLTTAVGFLALQVSSLKPIREFGWLAAVGVLFAFTMSMTVVPILLPKTKALDPSFMAKQREGLIHRLLSKIGRMTRAHAVVIWLIAIPLTALSLWSIPSIPVGANVMNYFKAGDPIREDVYKVDQALGGTSTLEFLIEAPDEGLKDPEILARIDEFARWTETLPGVSRAISVADVLRETNRALGGGDPAFAALPTSRAMAAQLYLVLEEDDDFQKLVREDYSVTRLTAQARLSSAGILTKELGLIDERLARDFPGDELKVSFTGYFKLMSEMENYLVESQVRSFSVSFVAITIMMFMLLGSVWLGLFAMIPNLMPIILGLGFMALTGIDLNPGTVMIGSIALGLVVDDTVHALVHLRRKVSEGHDLDAAISLTLTEAGRPILITSLVLAMGFSVMLLGSFTPNIYFGTVAAVVTLLAVVADLTLLPAALKLIRPKL